MFDETSRVPTDPPGCSCFVRLYFLMVSQPSVNLKYHGISHCEMSEPPEEITVKRLFSDMQIFKFQTPRAPCVGLNILETVKWLFHCVENGRRKCYRSCGDDDLESSARQNCPRLSPKASEAWKVALGERG